MRLQTPEQKSSGIDYWDVSRAASYLTSQACTISGRHLRDGLLRSSFNREVAYYARNIVRDVDEGRKTPEEGMAALEAEQQSLVSQSREIALKGFGVVAGGFQIAAGAGVCYGSGGWLCPSFGIPLMLHGGNNIYENGRNLATGRSDTQGPVRKVYQHTATLMGGGEFEGNMVYGAVDIGLSIYGAGRWTLKPDTWRLFRYMRTDYVRAYTQASKRSLQIDAISGTLTLRSMKSEVDQP